MSPLAEACSGGGYSDTMIMAPYNSKHSLFLQKMAFPQTCNPSTAYAGRHVCRKQMQKMEWSPIMFLNLNVGRNITAVFALLCCLKCKIQDLFFFVNEIFFR